MSSKRRLSSLLALVLCVCLIAGTMALNASAATAITKIRVTIDAPEAGKIPATTASVPSTANSRVEKVAWSGTLDADGTFMAKTSYKVTVTLGIKKGSNHIFSSKTINATVNGKKADEVYWYSNDKVEVVYTFPQTGAGTALTLARITLEEPAVGAKPAVTAGLPSTASTYIKGITWDGALDSNGCFQTGIEYTAYITLGVKDGLNKYFSEKSFDANVNGVVIDEVIRVSDKELIVPVEFNRLSGSAPAAVRELTEAHLTIDGPEAGMTPANTAIANSGDGCTVKGVSWSGPLNNGKFQEGVEYTATITLGIASGSNAKFSDTVFDAFVNGVLIDAATLTRVSDSELIVPVEFEKTAAPAAPAAQSVFTDVAASSPYAQAIAWAVEKGITNGTSPTTFTPDGTCSQAQILTFLWRAKGSPKPQGTVEMEGFTGSEYYYQAAMWAAEQNMIGGEFDPDAPCTRAMAVTYLWKQAGSPSAAAASFSDVSAGADHAQAVSWAVANGVTNGTGADTFSPANTCTRGQIATFLYRAFAS